MLKKALDVWNVFMKLAYILLTPFMALFMILVWTNDIVDTLNGNGN